MYSLGMLLFAFASESWMMFAFLIPYCLGGIAGPALQAVISIQVPSSEQGEIQGTLTSVMSASAIVGPPLMTGIFYYFTQEDSEIIFAGAPFLLGTILMIVSAIIAYFSFSRRKNIVETIE